MKQQLLMHRQALFSSKKTSLPSLDRLIEWESNMLPLCFMFKGDLFYLEYYENSKISLCVVQEVEAKDLKRSVIGTCFY